jgi:hypothetical protein
MEEQSIIKAIDAAHYKANNALKEKNFSHYISFFHDNLCYEQANGKTTGKAQLSIDTQRYFSRVKNVESNYQRLDYSNDGKFFVERLLQTVTVSIKVFLLFTKTWRVDREGIYKWINTND